MQAVASAAARVKPSPGSSIRVRTAGPTGRVSAVGERSRAGVTLVEARDRVKSAAEGEAPSSINYASTASMTTSGGWIGRRPHE